MTFLSVVALLASCASVREPAAGSGGATGLPGTGGTSGGTGSGGHVVTLPDAALSEGGAFHADAGQDATCGFESFDLQRKPVDLFVVLDRSASMQDDSQDDDANPDAGRPSKWSQVIPALTEVIKNADASIAWGLKTFPEDIPGSSAECAPASVTAKIDVPVTPKNAAQTATAVGNTSPDGDGTPTGAAVGVALEYLTKLGTNDRKYILLATDGEPSCGGSAGALTKDSSDAKTDAVAAVTKAAAADVHTFVIGVATTKSSATKTLNQLATAGLEPRADPDPAATKFYLASTQSELVTALQSIVAPIASGCVFQLNKAPPDPENIAVKVGGTKSPRDTARTDGWDYSDDRHTQVEVYGSWCDKVKQDANMVQIVYGCPNFVIP
ncbi:MAG TPA: VWA domain-containing protein [Polyangia bacterium]|nr:VWA domain-containing protein [Polyangia bacterium]